MSQQSLLEGFALYTAAQPPAVRSTLSATMRMDRNTMATSVGCRLQRIIRLPHGWRLWTATRDYKYGSYLELFDDGRVLNCTTRVDEGDDYYWCRPSDEETTQ